MKNNQPGDRKTMAAQPAAIAPETMHKPWLSQEEKIGLILLVCLMAVVWVIRSKFLSIPFERDEGAYGYYGKLLLEGKIPYKDFYEQKFPGIFYFYGFMVGVFGDTVEGLHTGFIFLNIATMTLIYFAARYLFSPFAGVISAATFAFVSMAPFLSGFTVQSEHGVAFFTSLGLFFYAMMRVKQKWFYTFLMGIAFGLAFMVKTSGIFFVFWGGLMILLDFFLSGEKKKFKDLIASVAIYGGGVLVFIVLLFLIIAMKDSFDEMIFWTYEIPKNYVGKIPFAMGMDFLKSNGNAIVTEYMFFWVHAVLAVFVCLIKPISNRTKAFGISLLFCSFMTVVPGLYFYGHYWIQTVPGLSMLAGLTYYSVITVAQHFNLKANTVKYVYLGIFALFTFAHASSFAGYYFTPDYDAILRGVYGNNPFPESMVIGDYINANSKPEDGIVLMGSEPQIYFYTKKKCPSRHAYFAALVNNVPQHKEWQREFVRDVEKAAPRYFVFFNHGISLFVQPNTDQYIFDWAKKYVNDNYKMVGIVDMIDGRPTVYLWKEKALTYKPTGQNMIYVFERK